MDAKTGHERKLDESDSIEYCIAMIMKHTLSDQQIMMTGLNSFGECIFNNKTAREMFEDHSIADITLAMNAVIEKGHHYNVLINFHSMKNGNNKNYWRIQKLYPFEEDDDSSQYTSQEENEDSDII